MKKIVGVIDIQECKLLINTKDQIWTLPGGKVEDGESDLEALTREVKEELSDSKLTEPIFYKSFEGISPRNKSQIDVRTYFGKVVGTLKPTSEIIDVRRASYEEMQNYNLSNLTREIVNSLKKDGYL